MHMTHKNAWGLCSFKLYNMQIVHLFFHKHFHEYILGISTIHNLENILANMVCMSYHNLT